MKRKVALRLGTLAHADWMLKPQAQMDLLKGRRRFEDLSDADVMLDARQKGVDMRIGLDIASLSFKQQVSKSASQQDRVDGRGCGLCPCRQAGPS